MFMERNKNNKINNEQSASPNNSNNKQYIKPNNIIKYKRYLYIFLLATSIMLMHKLIKDMNFSTSELSAILSALTPFITGFAIAYFLNIPCSFIERYLNKSKYKILVKKAKGISISIIYCTFLLVLFFSLRFVIPTLILSISDFAKSFSQYYQYIIEFIDKLPEDDYSWVKEIIIDTLNSISIQSLLSSISLENIMSSISLIKGFSSSIFTIFLTFISSIYGLLEKDNFIKYFNKFIPVIIKDKNSKVLYYYLDKINISFRKFIVCQLLDSCIIGTLVTIELWILGSEYALLLGVLLAVLNIIPYFGSIVGTFIAIFVMLLTNGGNSALITALLLITTQQIDGNIIQPKLMGNSFSLSPLLIIIGISFGGSIGGIVGMIVAIPIVNVIKSIVDELIESKNAIRGE
jgi:Predicted permease